MKPGPEKFLCIGGPADGQWHESMWGQDFRYIGAKEPHRVLSARLAAETMREEMIQVFYKFNEYHYRNPESWSNKPERIAYLTAPGISPMDALVLLMRHYRP